MVEEKKKIRKAIKELKSLQDKSLWLGKARVIFDRIERLKEFKQASRVLFYSSLPDEVPTHEALKRWSTLKEVYLPVVDGNDLRILRYEGDEKMSAEAKFGILEPTSTTEVAIDAVDFAVIPGVAFDRQCNRLGRGKGYYDRLLKQATATKVGVCFDFQLLNEIPVEKFDIPLDMIVTNEEVILPKSVQQP